MTITFYTAAAIAIIATLLVITRANAVHALLYLVVSLVALAVVFLTLGAPFAAALEVIVYAGAIMVLFVFVVMILSMGPRAVYQEKRWLTPGVWVGPSVLLLVLLAELVYVLAAGNPIGVVGRQAPPEVVGRRLLGPYLLAVELASMLLLGGLVGAYHLAYGLGRSEASAKAPGRHVEGGSA